MLLARLMLKPANLLILDEPTNDLDFQTLAVLEECIEEFPGAVILVTHDRRFLDEVCTKILSIPELIPFSDVDQWETWFRTKEGGKAPKKSASAPASSAPEPKKKRLSYKEQIEFEKMESVIQGKESELSDLETLSGYPQVASNAVELLKVTEKMGVLQSEIEKLYARWAELESKIG